MRLGCGFTLRSEGWSNLPQDQSSKPGQSGHALSRTSWESCRCWWLRRSISTSRERTKTSAFSVWEGKGVRQDNDEGFRWFQKGAPRPATAVHRQISDTCTIWGWGVPTRLRLLRSGIAKRRRREIRWARTILLICIYEAKASSRMTLPPSSGFSKLPCTDTPGPHQVGIHVRRGTRDCKGPDRGQRMDQGSADGRRFSRRRDATPDREDPEREPGYARAGARHETATCRRQPVSEKLPAL